MTKENGSDSIEQRNSNKFEQTVTARFDHIDYAGRLFYGRAFEYVHHVEEDFFNSIGWPIRKQKEKLGILFPLVNVEGEFHDPIKLDDRLTLQLMVSNVDRYSFGFHCDAYHRNSDQKVFDIDLTRVCMNAKTEEAQPIPEEFADALNKSGYNSQS